LEVEGVFTVFYSAFSILIYPAVFWAGLRMEWRSIGNIDV
jgi:hypothetical protein